MDQEKNHWLALYLSGKYPGYMKTPDKMLFIDTLQALSPKNFSDEKLKMFGMFGEVNEYEFYLSFINKVERESRNKGSSINFSTFVDSLNIPKEIKIQVLQKFFDHEYLLKEFEKVKNDKKPTSKGIAFEKFLNKFFDSMKGLEAVEIKQASDEQIDLIIKNNVDRPFWLNLGSSLMIGEAKHTEKLTKTEAIKKVIGTLDGHKNFSKIGVFISMEGFTKEKDEIQKRTGSGEKIIIVIQGNEIEELLESGKDPVDWFEEKILKAFK